jgi:hypothetical protein
MQRQDFITLPGGAAWPLAARVRRAATLVLD